MVAASHLVLLSLGSEPQPPELAVLTVLNLRGSTSLASLPAGIAALVQLRHLGLRNCPALASLPQEVGRLTALESLDLHGHRKLAALPPELGRCIALTELDLSQPPARGGIRDLLVAQPRLTELPSQLGALRNLRVLVLDGLATTLLVPPPATVALGVEAVIAYLRDLLEGGEPVPRRAALVMLVGETLAGKTSLWRSLCACEPRAQDVSLKYRTDGIEMHGAVWRDSQGREIDIAVWDYAGQEEYHLTHGFFLGHDCTHVLVWSAAPHPTSGAPASLRVLERWLRQLLCSVSLPRLLVVVTHAAVVASDERERISADIERRVHNVVVDGLFLVVEAEFVAHYAHMQRDRADELLKRIFTRSTAPLSRTR